MAASKSVFLTYLLWLLGGWFGLHHVYLGRDRQAFVWFMTLGGYFGAGWFRDLWRIPEYVREANNDPSFVEEMKEKIRKHEQPPSSTARSIGQMIVSDALGYLVFYSLPLEIIPEQYIPFAAILVPMAVAVGVHIVGNIGWQQGSLKWPLIGAYLTYPLYFYSTNSVFWTSLSSSSFFNWYSKEWRKNPEPKKPFLRRMFVLFLCCLLYSSLWFSWLYFNCSITDKDDNTIKCRDSVQHFFNSPMWQDTKQVLYQLYQYARHHGLRELWREFLEALDPHGEDNAIKILNLTKSVTQEEITSQYRKLAKQWHPDRYKDPAEKEEAQEKFIEIQKAYEVLSRIKSDRLKKNTQERENP